MAFAQPPQPIGVNAQTTKFAKAVIAFQQIVRNLVHSRRLLVLATVAMFVLAEAAYPSDKILVRLPTPTGFVRQALSASTVIACPSQICRAVQPT